MRKFIFLLGLVASFTVSAATLVSGKDGSTETNLNVNTSGQITTTLPNFDYELIAAGQTDQVMGATGGTGDYLDHCMISVATAASGAVTIKDGASSTWPTTQSAATQPLGYFNVDIRTKATTSAGWKITTGAGATATCFGFFN